jgi:hypothetical protein
VRHVRRDEGSSIAWVREGAVVGEEGVASE